MENAHPPGSKTQKQLNSRQKLYGETGIRTRDTTIFSRVLYQLSYLAADRASIALRCYRLASGRAALSPRLEFLHERLVGPPQPL